MTLLPLAVVSVAAALLLLRGRALWRWAACEAAAWLLFALLIALARPLGITVEPRLAVYTFGVLKLAMLFAFVAFAGDVRWSATRAAVVALLVYILVIFAMLPFPIDGDEPFYLLMTESMVKDHDLNLANQYRDLAHSATHRLDLTPQFGDRTGPHGESYSRLEPFLALLMVPGFALAGLSGALLTIALFGALLVRSTIRLFEDEGISDATARQLFPLIAFGPPIVFYATRIWPEVPAAWCFVEAVRGVRQRRAVRWGAALLGLVLLKVRFGLNPAPDADGAFDGPDNITVSPWGGLILAEDGVGVQHLIGVSAGGATFPLARDEGGGGEFTGPVFSHDKQVLFANTYAPGTMYAITGPWRPQR